jgi:hypothetical protein
MNFARLPVHNNANFGLKLPTTIVTVNSKSSALIAKRGLGIYHEEPSTQEIVAFYESAHAPLGFKVLRDSVHNLFYCRERTALLTLIRVSWNPFLRESMIITLNLSLLLTNLLMVC